MPELTGVFLAFFALVAAERILELRLNARNMRGLVARGGRIVEDDGYGAIVAVHALWFPAMLAEWFLAPWAGLHALSALFFAAFVAADALRYWSMNALGPRWTTKVVVLSDAPLVTVGPYRWLDHPIYVAVVAILVVLPLAFGLYATAAVVGAANVAVVLRRVRKEEEALRAFAPSRSTGGRAAP